MDRGGGEEADFTLKRGTHYHLTGLLKLLLGIIGCFGENENFSGVGGAEKSQALINLREMARVLGVEPV